MTLAAPRLPLADPRLEKLLSRLDELVAPLAPDLTMLPSWPIREAAAAAVLVLAAPPDGTAATVEAVLGSLPANATPFIRGMVVGLVLALAPEAPARTCASCRHWAAGPVWRGESERYCHRPDLAAETTGDGPSSIATRPEFGCVQWEPHL